MTDAPEDLQAPPQDDGEHPVPVVWRATLEAIVSCFVDGDWELERAPANVERLGSADAAALSAAFVNYGDVTLALLPSESWATSVCCYQSEGRWQVVVDLWTVEEGRSDLVLDTKVSSDGSEYRFSVHFVYVP